MEDFETEKEVAGLIVATKYLVDGQKDHETRIRKIEWFLATVIGAGGLWKFGPDVVKAFLTPGP